MRNVFRIMRPLVAICSLSAMVNGLSAGNDDRVPVPRSVGLGTGGDGAWTASHGAHCPATVSIDETAGPEHTPAAKLSLQFSSEKYNWCWAKAATGTIDPAGTLAVRVTYRTELPGNFPGLHVMVGETDGTAYWAPNVLPAAPNRYRTETVQLDRLSVPAWSSDENGQLDVDQICEVRIGVATGKSGNGTILIAEIQLIPAGW